VKNKSIDEKKRATRSEREMSNEMKTIIMLEQW